MTVMDYVLLYLSSVYPGKCDKAHLHLCCFCECLAPKPAVGWAGSIAPEQGPQTLHLLCEVSLPSAREEMAPSVPHLTDHLPSVCSVKYSGV